jgi:hypothetical protein
VCSESAHGLQRLQRWGRADQLVGLTVAGTGDRREHGQGLHVGDD